MCVCVCVCVCERERERERGGEREREGERETERETTRRRLKTKYAMHRTSLQEIIAHYVHWRTKKNNSRTKTKQKTNGVGNSFNEIQITYIDEFSLRIWNIHTHTHIYIYIHTHTLQIGVVRRIFLYSS